jgi:predicted PurR-regulated permease PerM
MDGDTRSPQSGGSGRGTWAALITLLLLWLAWQLADVLLLVFAGALLALLLRRLCLPLEQRLGWSPRAALPAVVAMMAVLLVSGSWLAGSRAAEQLRMLREALPRAAQALVAWLERSEIGRWLLDLWHRASAEPSDWASLASVATGTFNATMGAIGSAVLAIAIGIYLAADPAVYCRGFVLLWPPARREKAAETLVDAGTALSRWLSGQAISMMAVGAMTTLGLLALGMPLAVTLGVIAGILEFVPYFGTIVSGALVLAVALTESPQQAAWAAGVCLVVQQAESYVVQPNVQRWAVQLPPVLALVAVLVFGMLFGLPGVLLAVPLMVLAVTLLKTLYVDAMRP